MIAPSLTPPPDDVKSVRKIFLCPICKTRHEIFFPLKFADNRSRFPFTYSFIHSFQNAVNIEDTDKDILTTLYIDAQLNIRGVEAILTGEDTNIINRETSQTIIAKLTQVIMDMQEEYAALLKKFRDLKSTME
ncbi:MAG: hypothetical protein ACTSWW_04105 [Promethearchaeota archaeon]